jgi:hypothetical protein
VLVKLNTEVDAVLGIGEVGVDGVDWLLDVLGRVTDGGEVDYLEADKSCHSALCGQQDTTLSAAVGRAGAERRGAYAQCPTF